MRKIYSIAIAVLLLTATLSFGQSTQVSPVSFSTPVDFGPQCSGGQIHDDGVAENGYGWNASAGNPSGFCTKFIPTGYPYKFSKFCIALTRLASGVPNWTFKIVMWKSVNGAPGPIMDSTTVTASGLPTWPTVTFFDFNLPTTWANVTGTDSVFIGMLTNPVTMTGVFVASDESTTTPLWPAWATTAAGPWQSPTVLWSGYRAFLQRAEGSVAAPTTCTKIAGTWCPSTTYPSLPTSGYFHCSAWIGDTLYVQQPSSTGAGTTTVLKYTYGGSWTTGVPCLTGVTGASMSVVNGKLYLIGGGTTTVTTGTNNVQEYNPATGTWTAKSPLPAALSAHGSVTWGDSVIFVVGGPYTGAGTNLNVYYYRPASDTWGTITNSLPAGQGRRTFALSISGNKIIMSCGYNTAYLKSTYVGTIGSNAASLTWTQGADAPVAVSRPGGASYGNFAFVIGGDTNGTAVKNTKVFVYNVSGNTWITPILNCPNPSSNMMNAITVKCINDTARIFQPGGYGTAAFSNFDVTGCGAILTGNSNNTTQIPAEFTLSQNYPNPFNPTTKISYALPKSGLVTLKVYDILGKEVATLVNEVKNVGSYTVDFSGSNLSSGVYFYKLSVGDFSSIKKMTLIK